MVRIKAGTFLARDKRCFDGSIVEKRPRQEPPDRTSMTLNDFEIDRRVVSCADYERCVQSGHCSKDRYTCRGTVAQVARPSAATYCAWRRAKLPSYLEWQRAVRGVDGMLYRDNDPTNTYGIDVDQYGAVGKTHVSGDGVEYAMSSIIAEITRDDDCTLAGTAGQPTSTIDPLLIALDGPELTRVRLVDWSGRFRCVVER